MPLQRNSAFVLNLVGNGTDEIAIGNLSKNISKNRTTVSLAYLST